MFTYICLTASESSIHTKSLAYTLMATQLFYSLGSSIYIVYIYIYIYSLRCSFYWRVERWQNFSTSKILFWRACVFFFKSLLLLINRWLSSLDFPIIIWIDDISLKGFTDDFWNQQKSRQSWPVNDVTIWCYLISFSINVLCTTICLFKPYEYCSLKGKVGKWYHATSKNVCPVHIIHKTLYDWRIHIYIYIYIYIYTYRVRKKSTLVSPNRLIIIFLL